MTTTKQGKQIGKHTIKLSGDRGSVQRKIFNYEGERFIFKHNGSWYFCKQTNNEWVEYEIKLSQYKREVPEVN